MNALNLGSKTTLTITSLIILGYVALLVLLNLSRKEDIILLLQANTNDINVVRVVTGLKTIQILKKKAL